MNHINTKLVGAAFSLLIAISLTACSGTTSNGSDIQSQSSSENSAGSDSFSDNESAQSNESSGGVDASSDGESSAESHIYVKDGVFSLPENTLSFKMPEGWYLNDEVSIVYVFEGENTDNTFNLTVSKPDSNIQDLTADEMTKTYAVTLENFTLITFEHTAISDKPAVYMQLKGKLSQTEREMTLYQYMIQSGSKAYCFTFTQKNSDSSFKTDVIDFIIGEEDENGNYSGSLVIK